jgi:cyclophilin family peptidyl-prolyl cis-trans isomerase
LPALLTLVLFGLAACGGPGNLTPELQEYANQASVTGRDIPTLKSIASDRDNNVLYFEAVQLPEGLSLNPHTGWISGKPSKAGEHAVQVRVRDREGASVMRSFNWTVLRQGFDFRREGNDIVFTADNTDAAGTQAYCIRTGDGRPTADDPCWKSSSEGGLTLRYTMPDSKEVARHYLWTRDSAGKMADAAIGAPFSEALFKAAFATIRPVVAFRTTFGEFAIELQDKAAPISTENFLKYVREGFYDGTVFHRVISTFMVQTGGYTWSEADGYQRKAFNLPPITLENTKTTGLTHSKYTVGMARTNVLDSATTEFFINVEDNVFLDYAVEADGTVKDGYAVFGTVIFGADTAVEQIKTVTVEVGPGGEVSRPVGEPPRIQDALIIN